MERPYKRGQVIINPRFQFRVIGYAMLLGVFLVGTLYAENIFFFNRFVAQGLTMGLPQDHIYFQFIAQQKSAMSQSFLGTALFVMAAVAAWSLIVSHRIAGPIYRLCIDLAAMKKEGKNRRVKFREKDFFPELETAVNSFLAPGSSPSSSNDSRDGSKDRKSA